jgi:TonB family protein
MSGGHVSPHGTLLEIAFPEEKYGLSFLASVLLHCSVILFFLFAGYLLPQGQPIQIGTGPGGGSGGETYAIGVVDDLSGGIGMIKPSLVPQPPALLAEKVKEESKPEAIALPNTAKPKAPPRITEKAAEAARKAAPPTNSNVIPTAPQPGSGGAGGQSGGSGGGRGGGVGVSIGAGSGGLGDSWYARTVEARISSNWIRPVQAGRVEIIYSFVIASDGSIRDITKEKSSGSDELDLTAERAIRASNPLAPPPPELRSRPVKFMAQFIYPPSL